MAKEKQEARFSTELLMESLSAFTSDYACLSVSGSRRSLTRPFRVP